MQAPNLKLINIGQDTPYTNVLAMQEAMVEKVISSEESGALFICEHAPIYTCGTSTQMSADYIGGNNIPVVQIGRGGRITYHGPGQIVIYPIVDLRNRGRDLKKYVCDLEKWLISALKEVGVNAHTSEDVGVWVTTPKGEKKIAALGVRVRKWVAFHGIALNVCPDMNHFKGIVPCGIQEKGVTSLSELNVNITMKEMCEILIRHFNQTFTTTL